MRKIKICGLTKKEDIQMVNALMPDYIGFVFAKSKRRVTIKQAEELKRNLNPQIKVVGVFVNAMIPYIQQCVEEKVVDIVQLHGDEDADYIRCLREEIGDVPIIKAIPIGDKWEKVSYDVTYYLLDKKSTLSYGGTGECFDWKLIKELDKPYFLAGGINLENIEQALQVSAYGVDVSSGVETDGSKDYDKIHRIIKKVRNNCG
ncbi:MAG: phosphoribosylanthranilate isomerase [Cellulosilyticaceae bacterium]